MDNQVKLSFSNREEIRMGSPYMSADLHLEGLDIKVPNACWQDKFAISKDNKFIVLISFDFSNNEPGFRICIIDTDRKAITHTKRMFGLVNEISIDNRKILLNKFIYDKAKSKTSELCCNVNDEIDIE